ncbi:YcaO-like family protein [Streptomyces sp. NPDC008343]|uniref:YcaO-like family protein n=1 Tax=Streptomyces sp. NPDC008343 TaxID=3364828 RepID=UPI0036E66A6E
MAWQDSLPATLSPDRNHVPAPHKAYLELIDVAGDMRVPCVEARLWHEDLASIVACGSGAHSDPALAMSRAITEAVQSRLTQIVGARDDISPDAYRAIDLGRPAPPSRTLPWEAARSALPDREFVTDVAEADWLAAHITSLTARVPWRVTLAERHEFSVVKVICPRMRRASTERTAAGIGVAVGSR